MTQEKNLALKDRTREMPAAVASRKVIWVGRVICALPALLLIFSGVMKLAKPEPVLQEFARLGYTENVILGIGVLELICVAFYLVPRTAVLGAVLITGYLGGAIATHVRVDDPFIPPFIMGVVVWAGLYLRDARLRELLPLRKPL